MSKSEALTILQTVAFQEHSTGMLADVLNAPICISGIATEFFQDAIGMRLKCKDIFGMRLDCVLEKSRNARVKNI